jgi:hypothetical protein
MTVPNSDVQLSDIYWEAQFGGGSGDPGSPIVFGDLAGYDYFYGPNGNASISYNGWGQSTAVGLNRIYGLSVAASGPYLMGDYKNLVYFYDQTNYKVTITVINNLPPTPPPPPPIFNDVMDCNISFYDQSDTYMYLAGNSGGAPQGGVAGPNDISQPNTPIISEGYWYIDLNMDGTFGGGLCDIVINGTNYVNAAGIVAGPNLFDWNTYGSASVANTGTFIGLDVIITVY